MLKENRFDFILNELKKKKQLTYEWIAEKLDVSEDTIRRDIETLHKNGLLSKVRGGAMLRAKNPLTFQDRSHYLKKEKEVIGLKAQQFIRDGQTIFMDGGTTNLAIASLFPAALSARIITNNQALLPVLAGHPHIELIILGGKYSPTGAVTYGQATCRQAEEFIADLFFMGTCAVDATAGVSGDSQYDVDVKRAMIRAAGSVLALANHERLFRREPFKVCELSTLDTIITDLPSDHKDLD
ncbi:MAG: DeoR/GlpR transcriptional regulator, partial [Chitinophagaceae bacterium]|nr:DeoR/GlpR transcriptional regulator [Chitinophagaceae bacterium]